MHRNFSWSAVVCGFLLSSCSLYAQSPGGIRHQSFWFKGNFFSDSTKTVALNFNPATSMGDASKGIDMPGNIKDLRRATIFTVFQHPGLQQDLPVWQMNGGFGDLLLSTRQVSSKSGKMAMVFDSSKAGPADANKPEAIISTYVRRGVHGTSENESNKDIAIQFGNATYHTSPGQSPGLIAEFIVYETILKEKEIARIESYLAVKYGITLQKDYVNSAGQTIWNLKNEALYSNNIAGIGRDDNSTLYQKQGTSCSAPGQLIIGANKIALSNSKNTSRLNDKDYLIWGDNAGDFTFKRNATGQSNIILCEKKWLMKSSGSTANAISTELKINTKALLPASYPKELFCLAIDRSGSGDFTPGNCSYVMPDSISADGVATFSKVQWDTDGSGKDVFSFGLKTMLSTDLTTSPGAAKLISFRLYPNPLTEDGHYTIAVTLDKPVDINVQVFDIHAHLVESKKAKGQATYLLSGNINGAAGAYIVKLFTPGNEFTQIVIKP